MANWEEKQIGLVTPPPHCWTHPWGTDLEFRFKQKLEVCIAKQSWSGRGPACHHCLSTSVL